MKKVFLLGYVLCLFVGLIQAQGPAVTWLKQLEPFYNSGYTHLMCMDKEGNVFLANQFYEDTLFIDNKVVYNHSVKRYADVYVSKYNSAGKLLWVKSFGGFFEDRISAITTDSKGNVIFCLTFNSPWMQIGPYQVLNSDSNYEAHYSDIVMVKLDKNGDFIWLRGEYAPRGDECVLTLTCDDEDNLVVSGWFTSPKIHIGVNEINYIDGLRNGTRITDNFILKTNSEGNVDWVQRIGGSNSNDLIQQLVVDHDNNIILQGTSDYWSERNFEIGQTIVKKDSWKCNNYMAKLDAKGVLQWFLPARFNHHYYRGMSVDANNAIYITANFLDTLKTNDSFYVSHGDYDMYIQKYSPSGIQDWTITIGGYQGDYMSDITADHQGLLFTGSFNSDTLKMGDYIFYSHGNQTVYCAHVTPNGKIDWAYAIEGNNTIDPLRLATNTRGEVMILMTALADTMACQGKTYYQPQPDGFEYLMKWGPEKFTSIESSISQSSFTISPNPATDQVRVTFDHPQLTGEVCIQNTVGQIVLQQTFSGKELTLERNNLPEGLYFVHVTTEGEHAVKRLYFH